MATVTIPPQDLTGLRKSLNAHFQTARFTGLKATTRGGVLTVTMPVSRLATYKFDSNDYGCSWSGPKSSIVVQLKDVTVRDHVKKDTFEVVFRTLAQSGEDHTGGSAKDIFLKRSRRALEELARLDERDLIKASQQPDDVGVLLSALRSDNALTIQNHPLTGARMRGIEARRTMLAEEGGALTSASAAELLKVSRQAIDKRRKEGKLLAIGLGKKGYLYPAWQFDLEGLEKVLATLKDLGSWHKLNFFLNPSEALDDRTPLEVLQRGGGEVEAVLNAAAVYGDQG